MKYFIDTEFIEGFKKPLFGKKRHFIDLISIGIKCEDGREYYAISNEFNWKDADDWVKENVLANIQHEFLNDLSGDDRRYMLKKMEGKGVGNTTVVQKTIGKSNKQIVEEIKCFVYQDGIYQNGAIETKQDDIQFYAYYADYDWVVFCSLFGRMIDLPKGFPMYCIDLKQMLDETASIGRRHKEGFERALSSTKNHPNYPKQKNEHNALDDARWNLELYNFLDTIK